MSKMADLALTIEQMLVDGHSMMFIADELNIPVEWVENIREGLNDENDGQPDEAQEWHDFDPDC